MQRQVGVVGGAGLGHGPQVLSRVDRCRKMVFLQWDDHAEGRDSKNLGHQTLPIDKAIFVVCL